MDMDLHDLALIVFCVPYSLNSGTLYSKPEDFSVHLAIQTRGRIPSLLELLAKVDPPPHPKPLAPTSSSRWVGLGARQEDDVVIDV